MNTNIKMKELNSAKEIVNAGLLKAAETLSFFMKEEIQLDGFEFCFTPPCEKYVGERTSENNYVLITEIIGEVKGVCCLIFSSEEADQLRQAALPQEILNDPEVLKELEDGILLEVDNIISASVITQFSEILKVKMHGGVPSLKKLKKDELKDYIHELTDNSGYLINFNTHFASTNLNFQPAFIWLLNESFSECINKLETKQINM